MRRNKKLIIIISVLGVFLLLTGVFLFAILGGLAKPTVADVSSEQPGISEPSSSTEESSSDAVSSNSSEVTSSEPEVKKLDITYPQRDDITVYKNSVVIKGSADPSIPLYINDKVIAVGSDGIFSESVSL